MNKAAQRRELRNLISLVCCAAVSALSTFWLFTSDFWPQMVLYLLLVAAILFRHPLEE